MGLNRYLNIRKSLTPTTEELREISQVMSVAFRTKIQNVFFLFFYFLIFVGHLALF